LPRVILFENAQFNIPKEHYLAAKVFEFLGRPSDPLQIEFDQSYYADYYSDRMGAITRQARAAALAAVSPAAAAAFTGPREKADGIVYVLASGRVNGKPFTIRTEHLYAGGNDPATTQPAQYASIAEAALVRAARDIADAVQPK
jgi:hypothetical protein